MKDITTVTYVRIRDSVDYGSLYQCDECGFSEITIDFDYCPGCGKKIER